MKRPKVLISAFLIAGVISLTANSLPKTYKLKTDNVENAVGVGVRPYFGWQISDNDPNEIQSAYQILIATSANLLTEGKADVWDSGKKSNSLQNFVYLADNVNLKSDVKYFWTVRVWDKSGMAGDFAPAANFVAGLNNLEDWSEAKWINRTTVDKDIYSYFRKSLKLVDKKISKAVLYISASHSYEVYLNDKLCAKSSNFHYPQYAYYQAFDLSSFLKSGHNQFGVFTHWYGGGQGRAPGKDALILKMKVEYSDGSFALLVSDENWKTAKVGMFNASQPNRNGEGIGKIDMIDSRLDLKNWTSRNFDDSNWQFADVIGKHPVKPFVNSLRPDLTLLSENEIKAESIVKSESGAYIIDLGKIYAGRFKINFNSTEQYGDTIRIVGGFVLNEDGTLSEKIRQDTRMESYFVLGNVPSVFLPEVYLGMRYLQIENYKSQLTLDDIIFITRNFEMNEEEAEFNSSSNMLNKVWDLMSHSVKYGSQEGLVDTPTREKGGFLSDGWSQGVPALTVYGDRKMNNRILQEFFESQQQYWPDGRYNAVYPNVDGGRDIPDFTQQFVFWVWDYYLQTGNADFLRNNYTALVQTGYYLSSHLDDKIGLIKDLSGGKGPYEFGIIDWPADMRFGYDMATNYRTVINAYAYLDFVLLGEIADILDNNADSERFKSLAKELKLSINKSLINKEGLYVDGLKSDFSQSTHCSQQSNMIPLAMGISENNETVKSYVSSLGMRSGMVTLRFLVESLGESQQAEALYRLFTNTKDYGWANTIDRGATFTWECWTAMETNQSLSHPWGASGLKGMQNYFLGIKTLEPQNKVIQIKPLDFNAVEELSSVSGTYHTDQGMVKLSWKRTAKSFLLDLELPVNVSAEVYIPCANAFDREFELLSDGNPVNYTKQNGYIYLGKIGSGKYSFVRNFY